MKNYTITVNGTAYSVTVEEGTAAPAAAPAAPVSAPAAPAAPAPAPAAAPAPEVQGTAGGVDVTAQVPGKVLSIANGVGSSVKSGDPIIILESMKMEIPVVAPQDGTVASVNVAVGAQVESGDLLATMN